LPNITAFVHLHLSTLHNRYILVGLILSSTGVFKHFDNIHPINHLAEDHMLVVQEWRGRGCYKELATIGVWARILFLSVKSPFM
jgi:hypothetical protein